MDILIIGYSSLVDRKVLPALLLQKSIDKISIASRSLKRIDDILMGKRGELYNDYDDAIGKFQGEIVYISLPNSLHYIWARKCLTFGFHVIIDKPSVIEYGHALDLVKIAQKNNCCLVEANVWTYHPVARKLLEIIDEFGEPLHVNVIFSSPKMKGGNFRYNKKMGSGVILDRASYAISCGDLLFQQHPASSFCLENQVDKVNDIDISTNIIFKYPNGSTLCSFFSLGAEYENSILGISQSYKFEVKRIFTMPNDKPGTISYVVNNEQKNIHVKPANSFDLFIGSVISAIKNNDVNKFIEEFLAYAQILSEVRKNIKI